MSEEAEVSRPFRLAALAASLREKAANARRIHQVGWPWSPKFYVVMGRVTIEADEADVCAEALVLLEQLLGGRAVELGPSPGPADRPHDAGSTGHQSADEDDDPRRVGALDAAQPEQHGQGQGDDDAEGYPDQGMPP